MTAIGLRVKSGYALAVVLTGSRAAPKAVGRAIVELSDPDRPDTKQPYHNGFFTHEEDAAKIAGRVRIVKRCAMCSVEALVGRVLLDVGRVLSASARSSSRGKLRRTRRSAKREGGSDPASGGSKKTRPTFGIRAALVVGSVIDPATVGNPHIRAHAQEGRLFRTVLADALEANGVACDVIVDKTLAAAAAKGLGRSHGQIGKTLAMFGKALGPPWRADEKAAAMAAWLSLKSEI